MMGEDSLYCGASFLYGPGTNLHRTPYSGRATEYYSAAPVLNSLIGAEQVKGGWSKGLVMVVKHFSANDQEQNRIGVATFVTEQDLRENMLRGFEGLMTYGGAMGLMGSYNRLGVLGTAAEYDLMTTVLRKEWGSDCFVITDLNSPTAGLYDGNAIIAAGTSTAPSTRKAAHTSIPPCPRKPSGAIPRCASPCVKPPITCCTPSSTARP